MSYTLFCDYWLGSGISGAQELGRISGVRHTELAGCRKDSRPDPVPEWWR